METVEPDTSLLLVQGARLGSMSLSAVRLGSSASGFGFLRFKACRFEDSVCLQTLGWFSSFGVGRVALDLGSASPSPLDPKPNKTMAPSPKPATTRSLRVLGFGLGLRVLGFGFWVEAPGFRV